MQKEKGEIHSGIDGRGKGDIGLRHIVEAKGGRGIKNTNFLASLQNFMETAPRHSGVAQSAIVAQGGNQMFHTPNERAGIGRRGKAVISHAFPTGILTSK